MVNGAQEVSMVTSGAVAAIVGAMQAHAGYVGVREHVCTATVAIVLRGLPVGCGDWLRHYGHCECFVRW
jgi:hypothetical protein